LVSVLGLSAFYHDSAAALLVDGEIVGAAQEERFTRVKHDASFPRTSVRSVLELGGLQLSDVDLIAFYDKPFLKFERLLETFVAHAPRGLHAFRRAMPIWTREKLFQKRALVRSLSMLDEKVDIGPRLRFTEHHHSHAASAFYPSPFEEAIVLTADGVGEWATTSVAIGSGNSCRIVREIHFPHSLGFLYSAFTYHCGFKVNSGEYKLMGLAPYGEPRFRKLILEHLIDLRDDGSFRLDLSYFDYAVGSTMTSRKFDALFGHQARRPEEELTDVHMDMACSVQSVIEDVLLRITRALAKEYRIPHLCLAGGVALNCVANGRILRDGAFEELWVQPAAGDAGGSLGAALVVWHEELNASRQLRHPDSMKGSYLGPSTTLPEARLELGRCGAVWEEFSEDELFDLVAQELADGAVVGWHQGRMEFGPRALGNRSILADPRPTEMQRVLNQRIKFREDFRPFAPAVLAEAADQYFDIDQPSPYMLIVANVLARHRHEGFTESSGKLSDLLNVRRSDIPAVTHVDWSARLQTVHQETNPRFHALLSTFREKTGCPILVNTSFNIRGEPIVATPSEAFQCFMGTDLDLLVVNNLVMKKADQNPNRVRDYRGDHAAD
jgi:carbamoyltransferase